MANTFHKTAITSNDISVVINQIITIACRHMAFGHRHANSIGNALTKRAGCGFNAFGMTKFGMSGGAGTKLAEIANLLDGHIFVTGQVQKRINQHRAMSGR